MTSYERVFIETSALVDYTLKPEYRKKIDAILDKYSTKTSSNYVRMELKKGVITYLVYLHNKIINCGEWSEVQRAISKLSSTPQKHRLGTILEVLENFFAEIESATLPDIAQEYGQITHSEYLRRRSSSYLRLSIRRLWKQFEKIVDEDVNPMSCFIDIKPPVLVNGMFDNSPRTCDKSEFECKIKNFFRENSESFDRILDDLKKISEADRDVETKHRIKSLKEILRLLPYNNRKFSNRENPQRCWNCSDAILAVTSPEGAHILHHNPQHYNSICKSINKTGVTY